jgi:hypothetical protein
MSALRQERPSPQIDFERAFEKRFIETILGTA